MGVHVGVHVDIKWGQWGGVQLVACAQGGGPSACTGMGILYRHMQRMRAHMHMHTHTRTHARTHASMHTRTQAERETHTDGGPLV